MSTIDDLAHLDVPPYCGPQAAVPTGLPLHAVGWLGSSVVSEGPTPDAVIDRLVAAEAAKEVFSDNTLGWHRCEICDQPIDRPKHVWRDASFETRGYGFLMIEGAERAYVAPRMLIHYILAHHYRPPDEFLTAVLNGRFLQPPPLTAEMTTLISKHSPPPRGRNQLVLLVSVAFVAIVAVLSQLFGR